MTFPVYARFETVPIDELGHVLANKIAADEDINVIAACCPVSRIHQRSGLSQFHDSPAGASPKVWSMYYQATGMFPDEYGWIITFRQDSEDLVSIIGFYNADFNARSRHWTLANELNYSNSDEIASITVTIYSSSCSNLYAISSYAKMKSEG